MLFADLRGALVTGAQLSGADLTGARRADDDRAIPGYVLDRGFLRRA
jgi:uncharacterized protein YjbI with pentapeptide repeats